MLKKFTRSMMALTFVLGLGAAMIQPAEAQRRGSVAAGVAVGTLLGLGIAGAYAGPRYYGGPTYHYGPECYPGPRQCVRAERSCWYNRFGDYMCSGGEWRCWRPTICD